MLQCWYKLNSSCSRAQRTQSLNAFVVRENDLKKHDGGKAPAGKIKRSER